MNLAAIHERLATSLLLFMAIAAAWNLFAAARRRGVSSSTWGILAIGEVLALAEAAVGLAIYLGGERPARAVHLLYGLTAVLTLPAYYFISRGRDDRTASWIYGALCFFLAFAAYRSMVTG
jgi:CDP-diglyceride synthetase